MSRLGVNGALLRKAWMVHLACNVWNDRWVGSGYEKLSVLLAVTE